MAKESPAETPFRVIKFKGKGRQPWRYRFVAGNNKVISTSEGYLTKWNRDRAVKNTGLEAAGIKVEEET